MFKYRLQEGYIHSTNYFNELNYMCELLCLLYTLIIIKPTLFATQISG